MNKLLFTVAVFCIGVVVGCVTMDSNPVSAVPFAAGNIPKSPPRIEDRFVITPCPEQWKNEPELCKWWNDYQILEEYRYRQLVAAINNGYSVTFEAVRGVAP